MASEICTIKILLPAVTDEQAIDYKKKITELVADVPNAVVEFRLIAGKPPMPSG